MSALDSLLAAAPDAGLLPGFDYSVIPSSSAVVDRKQSKVAHPTSATTLTAGGTTHCRIPIGSDGFCDSSSVRLAFTVQNNDTTKALAPTGGPWCAWGSVRLMSQGTEVERIDLYGRHHELFGFQLLPFQEQWSESAVCGLHGSWASGMSQLQPKVGRISAGKSVTVMHKLHLSLFNSHKILPLRFCPLSLELQIAPVNHWCDVTTQEAGEDKYSNLFSIADIRVIYDEIEPDQAIVSSFYKGLLANQIMAIPVLCASQFTADVPSSASTLDVMSSRSFSKISSVWVTFSTVIGDNNVAFSCPSSHVGEVHGEQPLMDSGSPSWAPSFRLSIGGKNVPDPLPADSIQMQYYNLVRALGYSPNLTRQDYLFGTYATVFDMKRVPFDHGSGISSRSGDQIRIEVRNMTPGNVKTCHVTVFNYAVVAIRESGVSLLN